MDKPGPRSRANSLATAPEPGGGVHLGCEVGLELHARFKGEILRRRLAGQRTTQADLLRELIADAARDWPGL